MKLAELRITEQDQQIQEMAELFAAIGQYRVMLSEGQLDEAGAWDKIKGAFGKGVAGVKTANDAINKLGALAQKTGPVQNFDSKVENLLKKIGDANPKVAELAQKYGEWAKKNPVKQGLIIGMLTATASVLGGPGGGAAAGAVLRAGNELLKGERASTAVGRAAKSAALGAGLGVLAGASASAIGQAFMAAEPVMEPLKQLNDVVRLRINTNFNGQPILNINQLFPKDVANDLSKLSRQAGDAMFNGDRNRASGLLMQINRLVQSQDVANQVSNMLAQNDAISAQNDAIRQAWAARAEEVAQTNAQIKSIVDAISAGATGAVQGAAAASGSKPGSSAPAAKPAAQKPAAAPAPDKRAELKARQQAWQAQQRRMGKLK